MKRIDPQAILAMYEKHGLRPMPGTTLGPGTACLIGILYMDLCPKEALAAQRENSANFGDAMGLLTQLDYSKSYLGGLMSGFDSPDVYRNHRTSDGDFRIGHEDGRAAHLAVAKAMP